MNAINASAIVSPRCLRSGKKIDDSFKDIQNVKASCVQEIHSKTNNSKVNKSKNKKIKIEHNENEELDTKDDVRTELLGTSHYFNTQTVPSSLKASKGKRQPIKIDYDTDKNVLEKNEWFPQNWQALLNNIREMRKYKTAPVDEMGCDKCADPTTDAATSRYQSLVALMLSSQTKDQITHAAVQRLISHGCTPNNIVNTPDELLGKLIYPVGFWKSKVQFLKKTAMILMNQYDNDIPKTVDELCKLPGVGPKMAHICMNVAWGELSGIGVDTHVHRISNRLGWVKKTTKKPEDTRIQLESWLPKEYWSEVNHLLVGFGQEICLPRFPKCDQCLNFNICPFSKSNKDK